jgi:MFS family permease
LISIAAVFLSDDLGLTDAQAGYSLTVFTTATTLCLFFSGMVTDWLGIKNRSTLRCSRCWCCAWAWR